MKKLIIEIPLAKHVPIGNVVGLAEQVMSVTKKALASCWFGPKPFYDTEGMTIRVESIPPPRLEPLPRRPVLPHA